jgi:pimeloyl-ACP methyl ester carboxylesterase
LELPPGRTLAYTTCGAPASTSRLLLAFHGALGVGDFSTFDSVFKNEGYHVVSPTLPGWGASSDASTEIWVTDYFQDILVLIRELENQMNKKIGSLNLMGVSYGSLAALHLAVNLEKNGGPKVGKCLVMSGFVPFRMPGLDYSIGMTFQQRLTMGTFAKWNPWFARFTASVVGRYLTTIEDAVKFATDNISKTMNATETEQLEAIRKRNPKDPRCDPSAIGRNMFFSLRMSKKGYTTIPQNLW